MKQNKSNLPTGKRIFSDVTSVSRGAAISLSQTGLTNKQSIVVSWSYLSPFIRDRMLSEQEAKQLILLELYRLDGQTPRGEIVYRLTGYLVSIDREQVRNKIFKETGVEI